MADEWVRMRGSLLRNPKVIRMARFLSEDEFFRDWWTRGTGVRCDETVTEVCDMQIVTRVTVASLLSVWSSANLVITPDDIVPHATLYEIDEMAGAPSFGPAMQLVGWAEEIDGGGVRLPNFKEHNTPGKSRGPKSGAERTKEWRRRKQNRDGNVTNCDENVTSHSDGNVTKCDDRLDKIREEKIREDKIREDPPHSPPGGGNERALRSIDSGPGRPRSGRPAGRRDAGPPGSEAASAEEVELLDQWNRLPGVCTARRPLSAKRRKALRARLKDPAFRDQWREAIELIPQCPFLQGHNDRGWRADLEWFLRPDSVQRIVEGKYQNKRKRGADHAGLRQALNRREST